MRLAVGLHPAWMVLIALLCAGGLASCASAPRADDAQQPWPFTPQSIAVLPLSRLQETPGGLQIEAWVQLRDKDGYATRGLGTLNIELDSAGPGDLHNLHWTTHLESSGEGVQSRFDPVTHAYLLPLDVSDRVLPHRPRLKATLVTPSGRRFSDQWTLPETSDD